MRSCLAFAFKLVDQKLGIERCKPLFTNQFKEKRKILLDTLRDAGLNDSSKFLESSTS